MQTALAHGRLLTTARDATPQRPIALALAVSFALHLACLALLAPAPVESSHAPMAIEVELVPSDDLAPQAGAPADIPEEQASATAMQDAAAAAPQQAEAAPPKPVEEPKPQVSDAEAIASREQEKAQQAQQAAQPAAPSMAAAADSEAEAARRERAKAYASAVSAELNRRRIYPAAARARGITGAAKVGFSIDATGKVARFAILASSGHGILDESVSKIMQAMHTPPPPEGAFEAVVTIRFGLR